MRNGWRGRHRLKGLAFGCVRDPTQLEQRQASYNFVGDGGTHRWRYGNLDKIDDHFLGGLIIPFHLLPPYLHQDLSVGRQSEMASAIPSERLPSPRVEIFALQFLCAARSRRQKRRFATLRPMLNRGGSACTIVTPTPNDILFSGQTPNVRRPLHWHPDGCQDR